MRFLFIIPMCVLLNLSSHAQFFILNNLQKSEITTGGYRGTSISLGLGYNISKHISISLFYETNTASELSFILGNLKSNDSVVVTAAFRSQPTDISKATVYNVHNYEEALAILKEKPDRITINSIKTGIAFKPIQSKKHQFYAGINIGLSKIVSNRFVQANNGVFTPALSLPEHVVIVTPYFSNTLDITINPTLQYYYKISPTVEIGCAFNADYFYFSGDYNWNYGITSRINLHKYKE